MESPQKFKNQITEQSSYSTSRNLPKGNRLLPKDICTPMFIAALFTIAKIWKQARCPRKKEIQMFATMWMDLEGIMLSEMSDREGQVLHGIIYMWNLLINKKLNS